MFPLDGFQFAFYGFATLAVSVGYAWTRNMTLRPRPDRSRRNSTKQSGDLGSVSLPDRTPPCSESTSASQSPPKKNIPAGEQASMVNELITRKRKYSEDDDCSEKSGYPHNLSSIYPNKRSKTPTSDTESEMVRTPPADEPLLLESSLASVKQSDALFTSRDICDETRVDHISRGTQPSISEAGIPAATSAVLLQSPLPLPSGPGPCTEVIIESKSNATGGFASFASADSSFYAVGNGPLQPAIKENSIWQSNPANTNTDSENPLAAECHARTTYTHITGEEDETIESELKGVKLYMKRSSKEFTDGMIGHIKLLSSKTSECQRLLFRREPLWQVSMNVRLHPLVRCLFDEESHVLRLILKEPVEKANTPVEQWPQEVVIYVFKRGRVPKETFRKFAEALLASSHLKGSSS